MMFNHKIAMYFNENSRIKDDLQSVLYCDFYLSVQSYWRFHWYCFTHSAISYETSSYFLIYSGVKPKPAAVRLPVFASTSDWLIVLYVSVNAHSDWLGSSFTSVYINLGMMIS